MPKVHIDKISQGFNIGIAVWILLGGQLFAYIASEENFWIRGFIASVIAFIIHMFIVGTLKPTFAENKKRFLISILVSVLILWANSGV